MLHLACPVFVTRDGASKAECGSSCCTSDHSRPPLTSNSASTLSPRKSVSPSPKGRNPVVRWIKRMKSLPMSFGDSWMFEGEHTAILRSYQLHLAVTPPHPHGQGSPRCLWCCSSQRPVPRIHLSRVGTPSSGRGTWRQVGRTGGRAILRWPKLWHRGGTEQYAVDHAGVIRFTSPVQGGSYLDAADSSPNNGPVPSLENSSCSTRLSEH